MKNNHIRPSKVIHFLPSGQFYFDRGIAAFREGQMEEAIQCFKRASELEPKEALILCQLAICHTEIGQFRKSNQILWQSLKKIDRHLFCCYYFIANNFAYMKDYRRAVKYAYYYIKKDPQGEYVKEANKLIDKVLKASNEKWLENHFSAAEFELSDCKSELNHYLAGKNNESACTLLEKMIQNKPHFWPAYNQLASLYFKRFKEKEGLRTLETLLQRSPGNLLGLADLFSYHYYASHHQEINEYYDRLCQIVPVLTYHKEKLAIVHAMMGNYAKAYQLFTTISELEVVERSKFYYYYAKSAYRNYHPELARELWAQFVACNPYERTAFPFQEPTFLANNVRKVLSLLSSPNKEEHLVGVYALSVSEARVELTLFHPLFDTSRWSFLEHLIFTDFDQPAESLPEQNGMLLIQLWNHFAMNGIPLTEETQPFYERMSQAYFEMTEKGTAFLRHGFAKMGARFLVQCGDYSKQQAARFFSIDHLDF